eukprot:7012979-Prymnesium_polylepis.1
MRRRRRRAKQPARTSDDEDASFLPAGGGRPPLKQVQSVAQTQRFWLASHPQNALAKYTASVRMLMRAPNGTAGSRSHE